LEGEDLKGGVHVMDDAGATAAHGRMPVIALKRLPAALQSLLGFGGIKGVHAGSSLQVLRTSKVKVPSRVKGAARTFRY
jgi:hypothetical protein